MEVEEDNKAEGTEEEDRIAAIQTAAAVETGLGLNLLIKDSSPQALMEVEVIMIEVAIKEIATMTEVEEVEIEEAISRETVVASTVDQRK
jgi:hypothetical protein